MNAGLHKCATPDCLRLVSAASAHCCRACVLAAEGRYEIHEDGPLGHSRSCDERDFAAISNTPIDGERPVWRG